MDRTGYARSSSESCPSGFGSELIGQALPYRPGMEARLEFRGGGVRCTISVPLSDKAASAQARETPS
jgi:hypothetical protein